MSDGSSQASENDRSFRAKARARFGAMGRDEFEKEGNRITKELNEAERVYSEALEKLKDAREANSLFIRAVVDRLRNTP